MTNEIMQALGFAALFGIFYGLTAAIAWDIFKF